MTRTSSSTSKNPSKKRNQEETSLSDDSEPQRKIRKNNKKIRDERDDDNNHSIDQNSTTSTSAESKKVSKWCSYKSSVYRIDLSALLHKIVSFASYDLFFNYENMRDEMIKLILKNYEATLMIEKHNTNRRSIDTHGQFHLNESIQYKRNQCKIVEDENCREVYLCVHSEEFSTKKGFKLPKNNNNSLFFIDGWLIYRCATMKSKNITAFNTIHGQMIGNKEDKKTLHWLGIHGNHCTIRTIEHEISEITDNKKEKSLDFQMASNEEIEKELAKLRATPIEEFIPRILNLNNISSTPLFIAPTVQPYYQPEIEQTQVQSFESEYNSIVPPPINKTHTYLKPQETEYYTTTESLPIVHNDYLMVEDHERTNKNDGISDDDDIFKNFDTNIIDEFDINMQWVSR